MSELIENPEAYFRKFIPERDSFLMALEKEAAQEEIPIVGPVVGQLLHILALSTGARMILELGTATGYSGIFLAKAAAENKGRLITLEWNRQMAQRARTNFAKAGVADVVTVLEGDALKVVSEYDGLFDFIFMDIDKEFYAPLLPGLRKKTKTGGFLLADNVAFKDSGPFNLAISESRDWKSINLFSLLPAHSPENDGLCFAVAV